MYSHENLEKIVSMKTKYLPLWGSNIKLNLFTELVAIEEVAQPQRVDEIQLDCEPRITLREFYMQFMEDDNSKSK